jgi:hypothetical protein
MHGALNDPAYSSLRAELEKLLNAQ